MPVDPIKESGGRQPSANQKICAVICDVYALLGRSGLRPYECAGAMMSIAVNICVRNHMGTGTIGNLFLNYFTAARADYKKNLN